VAVEIGSYLGASTCYIAAGLGQVGGRLYCVDTWQNQTMPDGERDTWAEFKINTEGVKHLLHVLRKPSDQLADADIPSKVDFVFIDADHSYQATRADFDKVFPRLSNDAVVAFHDHYFFGGVAKVIGEVLASGNWAVAGVVQNLLWLKRFRFTK
jgi:predicted O-methyltransferase YrrM